MGNDKFPSKIPIGWYKAIKNAEGYYIISIGKKAADKLNLQGGEDFWLDFNEREDRLEYTRRDKTK